MQQNDILVTPQHIGLILDGNRRWAKSKGIPTLEGHKKGYENLKVIAEAALDKGVKYLSAYVFSTENWNRSKEEVSYLMDLLFWVAKHEVNILHKKGIKVRFLGTEDKLSPKLIKAIRSAEQKTKNNTKGTLALCMNYGGHQEIADAFKKMMAKDVDPETITPDEITKYLYAPDIPPLDIVVRTSGEQRLSNFMMWRSAYSELFFVDKMWPDFTPADLDAILAEYTKRERRHGG